MRLSCLSRGLYSIKTMSLVVVSLQTTTMVLMLRYSRVIHTSPEKVSHQQVVDSQQASEALQDKIEGQHYVISTVVCIAEIMKLMLSLFFLHLQNGKLH